PPCANPARVCALCDLTCTLCDPLRATSRVLPASSSLPLDASLLIRALLILSARFSVHPLDSFHTSRPVTTPMPFLFIPLIPRNCTDCARTVSLTRISHWLVYPYVSSYLSTLYILPRALEFLTVSFTVASLDCITMNSIYTLVAACVKNRIDSK
ncbi:uncharacterized protein SCHCODRAFT_02727091, partial [Schizophyllum commune H4-8]|uniref:uncharacterized protein n=1 Tax=Schizophyllum commune (strain H4-8 / FGSC 9210) TaxID=578458 RepID=UPI00215E8368